MSMMENFAKIGFLFTYDKVLNMPLISFSKHEQIFKEIELEVNYKCARIVPLM